MRTPDYRIFSHLRNKRVAHDWYLQPGRRSWYVCLRCGATVCSIKLSFPLKKIDFPTFRSPLNLRPNDPCPEVMKDVHSS